MKKGIKYKIPAVKMGEMRRGSLFRRSILIELGRRQDQAPLLFPLSFLLSAHITTAHEQS